MYNLAAKPTYYIWITEDMVEEEVEQIKNFWTLMGFRVVTFKDGSKEKDINIGLKAIIRNHIRS